MYATPTECQPNYSLIIIIIITINVNCKMFPQTLLQAILHWFEAYAALHLRVQVFWAVTLCRWDRSWRRFFETSGNYWLRKGSCTWKVHGIVDISFISIMVPIFWNMTLNDVVEGYRRFKGKYILYYLSSLTHITNTTVYSETPLHISKKIRCYPPRRQ
jgi:hypothetical protein